MNTKMPSWLAPVLLIFFLFLLHLSDIRINYLTQLSKKEQQQLQAHQTLLKENNSKIENYQITIDSLLADNERYQEQFDSLKQVYIEKEEILKNYKSHIYQLKTQLHALPNFNYQDSSLYVIDRLLPD